MRTDPSASCSGSLRAGAVAALWRYPVKSLVGEELNSCRLTDRGLVGVAGEAEQPCVRNARH